jgi:hypothetical protein
MDNWSEIQRVFVPLPYVFGIAAHQITEQKEFRSIRQNIHSIAIQCRQVLIFGAE